MTRHLLTMLLIGGWLTVSGCNKSVIVDHIPKSANESYATAVFFDRSEPDASHAIAPHAPNNAVALLINVKNALVREPQLELYTLEVGVLDGVVTLYGEVDTHEHRMMAEQIARNVRGVESVKSGIVVMNHV